MNVKETDRPSNPDVRDAMAAMQRAAELARTTAIQTETAIIIVQDGKRIRITAEELRKQRAAGTP
jgi:hypothetical protein